MLIEKKNNKKVKGIKEKKIKKKEKREANLLSGEKMKKELSGGMGLILLAGTLDSRLSFTGALSAGWSPAACSSAPSSSSGSSSPRISAA